MFIRIFGLILFTTLMVSCSEQNKPEFIKDIQNKKLDYPDSLIDQFSYSLGHEFGSRLRRDSVNLNMEYYLKGYLDGLDSNVAFIPFDSMQVYMARFTEKMMKKMDAMAQKQQEEQKRVQDSVQKQLENLGKTAKEDGERFLSENKNNTGVTTTKSGLQYRIINPGNGKTPTESDIVKVHMSIKALNAPDFQDTRGKDPLIISVKELFPGWKEGMMLMKKGAQFELFIPSNLAFGEKGFGPAFPPHVVVVMKIDFLDFSNQDELTQFRDKMMQMQQQQQQEMMKRQQMQPPPQQPR